MSINEEKAVTAFSKLLSTLSTLDKDRVAKLSRFLHPHCNGYGTAIQEIFKTRSDWLSLFEEEAVQIPNGIQVSSKWCETFVVDVSTVGLIAETIFKVNISNNDFLEFDPIRMTIIYKIEENELLIRHWHNSYPLGESNDEIFPGSKEPRLYEEVSVLFSDFVGFTNIVSGISPKKLVEELNALFVKFDDIIKGHQLIKVKTIGDSYMAVGGLKDHKNHATNAVKSAIEMMRFLDQRNDSTLLKWNMKAGIHSGPVIGGVIGHDKLVFDIWGDTVNIASRLESTSEKGKINISSQTYDLIKGQFTCKYRGKINAKGKGVMDMYFVN